jgi:glutathione S-transferase
MLHLIIGNKNYSSWSFRPWIAMKVAGIAFQETVISLEAADFKARVQAISGAGKVPVLADGDVRLWESLAILEYLAEKFPAAGLWPRDAAARGHARAISAEMHAGFQPLRRQLPMNMWRPVLPRQLDPDAKADVARIDEIWTDCRARLGAGGPFLYGAFGAADAGGLALPHLCGRPQFGRARLYVCGHGAAGLEGMARRCATRALGSAARRSRLARGQTGVEVKRV